MLISIKETSARLGIGRSSVYKLLYNNELVVVRVNRRTLVTEASVRELVARSTVRAALKPEGDR